MQFDIKRDLEIIAAGGFWCKACCVGRPAAERSPDERYCQGCYEYLLAEADILIESGSKRRPAWIPKDTGERSCRVQGEVS
jgi:hypothetical protein